MRPGERPRPDIWLARRRPPSDEYDALIGELARCACRRPVERGPDGPRPRMRVPLEVPGSTREQRHAAVPVHVDHVHGVPRPDQVPAHLSQESGRNGLEHVGRPLDPSSGESATQSARGRFNRGRRAHVRRGSGRLGLDQPHHRIGEIATAATSSTRIPSRGAMLAANTAGRIRSRFMPTVPGAPVAVSARVSRSPFAVSHSSSGMPSPIPAAARSSAPLSSGPASFVPSTGSGPLSQSVTRSTAFRPKAR